MAGTTTSMSDPRGFGVAEGDAVNVREILDSTSSCCGGCCCCCSLAQAPTSPYTFVSPSPPSKLALTPHAGGGGGGRAILLLCWEVSSETDMPSGSFSALDEVEAEDEELGNPRRLFITLRPIFFISHAAVGSFQLLYKEVSFQTNDLRTGGTAGTYRSARCGAVGCGEARRTALGFQIVFIIVLNNKELKVRCCHIIILLESVFYS